MGLQFDPESEQEQSLRVQVREIHNCKSQQDGTRLNITDADDQDVGACWPDMNLGITLRLCVVVAMDSSIGEPGLADEERTYYVLFVKHGSGENLFERLGAGRIKARCVSIHACAGRLV
jgi:hypothetical protein